MKLFWLVECDDSEDENQFFLSAKRVSNQDMRRRVWVPKEPNYSRCKIHINVSWCIVLSLFFTLNTHFKSKYLAAML